jgi:hypothetical protein
MTQKLGVVIGRGKETDQLEIVVAFQERDKAPKLGEFLIIEETEFLKRKLLARVEEFSYGDFQATKDERIRALVEKYIREISGVGRELSEEEKRALFFRHYILKVLGEIDNSKIKTDYRILPELTSLCRKPTDDELKTVLCAGLEDAEHLIYIGHLSIGEEQRETEIVFDLDKLRDRRTAIFARTGYGKSNLCKLVVSLASLTGVGLLIFDMDGEYAFGDPSRKTIGLADVPGINKNLVIYTHRSYDSKKYNDLEVHHIINLELLRPYQIASLFPEAGGDEAKAITHVRGLPILPIEFINCVQKYTNILTEEDKYECIGRAARSIAPQKAGKVDEAQVGVLNRNLRWLFPLHRPNAPNIITDIRKKMEEEKTVVVDLSLLTTELGVSLSNTILEAIFRYNVTNITQGKLIECIAVFEEAQNVLNNKSVNEGLSYFVRWAKEGRKYHLGLIYVTQQPGAIAEEIVSQTDNFFIMHLLGKGDIDALRNANPHYDGVISNFLKNETITGNTYIYSAPKQPYVFPCRILEFTLANVSEIQNKLKKAQPS